MSTNLHWFPPTCFRSHFNTRLLKGSPTEQRNQVCFTLCHIMHVSKETKFINFLHTVSHALCMSAKKPSLLHTVTAKKPSLLHTVSHYACQQRNQVYFTLCHSKETKFTSHCVTLCMSALMVYVPVAIVLSEDKSCSFLYFEGSGECFISPEMTNGVT